VTLDKAEIQGNLLRGYTYPHAAYVFFEVVQPRAAREFLASLKVTPALHWTAGRPSTATNVCLTFAGLQQLAQQGAVADDALLDAMRVRYPAFAEGMYARRQRLGDPDIGTHPDWTRAQVWVSLFAQEKGTLDRELASILAATKDGLRPLFGGALFGRAIERGETRFEHFGFQDNISNPEIEGASEPGESTPLNLGNGKRDPDGRYATIRAGEFLLGHVNESGDLLPEDPLAQFVKNGTFAVFRDLKQNVHTRASMDEAWRSRFSVSREPSRRLSRYRKASKSSRGRGPTTSC
jgi:deferrochelatase/peroxidase EfeB